MMARRSRSRGIRQPVRNAVLCSLLTGVGIALVVLGVLDMRATGNTGSPLLALGLLPALLAPIALIHALMHVKVFRDLRSGRTVTARWTVSADEFKRFCEADRRNPAGSVMTNFYKPPPSIPADGVEVVFSDTGVMIGDGYFPLSATRGRRLEGVHEVVSDPPSIEFTTAFKGLVRTSSTTYESTRTVHLLRVPVASDAQTEAGAVVRSYQTILDSR